MFARTYVHTFAVTHERKQKAQHITFSVYMSAINNETGFNTNFKVDINRRHTNRRFRVSGKLSGYK